MVHYCSAFTKTCRVVFFHLGEWTSADARLGIQVTIVRWEGRLHWTPMCFLGKHLHVFLGAATNHWSDIVERILQSASVPQVSLDPLQFLFVWIHLKLSNVNAESSSVPRFKQCRKTHCEHISKIDRYERFKFWNSKSHQNNRNIDGDQVPALIVWISHQGGDASMQGDVLCFSAIMFTLYMWKVNVTWWSIFFMS